MTRRVRFRAAIAALAALPVLTGSVAEAGSQQVTVAQLPTLAQAVAVYPDLAGGRRTIEWVPWNEILLPAADCMVHDTAAIARHSKQAGYASKEPLPEDEVGITGRSVAVFEFARRAQAEQLMRKVRQMRARCAGSFASPPDYFVTRTRAAIPKIGVESTGYRTRITGMDELVELEIFARIGRRVVLTTVSHPSTAPSKYPAIRLTRAAVRLQP